jgi:hypothetical protein
MIPLKTNNYNPMKNIYISLVLVFLVSLASAKPTIGGAKTKQVTVEINFGEVKDAKSVTIDCDKKLTALEALQLAADVETHPVGNYVFVTAIDEVVSTRGKMAWYYKINGESSTKLAISQSVKAGDVIIWRYVKDVCSCTVDGKEK